MPWATIRLDDRDSRRSFARRAAASHGHFDDDTDDQGAPTPPIHRKSLPSVTWILIYIGFYIENDRSGMLKPWRGKGGNYITFHKYVNRLKSTWESKAHGSSLV